jgi:hypothetical protein
MALSRRGLRMAELMMMANVSETPMGQKKKEEGNMFSRVF